MAEDLIVSNMINQLKELESNSKDSNQLLKKTKHLMTLYSTCRIDIKNRKNKDNSISILNCSDDKAEIEKPKWLNKDNGGGVVVNSIKGHLNLEFICVNDGELILTFRGVDFKNEKKVRVPIYIECTGINVDGKSILEEPIFICHDNFYRFRMDVTNNQKVKLDISWKTVRDDISCDNKDLNKINNDFNNKFDELNKQFNAYKKETNSILDSHYNLFNTILKHYELKPKGVMEKIQLLNLELLNFIDNVCKKYHLQYWIDCGTLLGAFRHADFIPWDDDIDLGMMRKDYEKLLKVLKEEVKIHNLDKYITVERMDRVNNNNFLISFMKLSFRINHTLFGFIDIFPFDYRSSEEGIDFKLYMSERKKFFKKVADGKDKKESFKEAYKNLGLTQNVEDFIVPGIDGTRVPSYGLHIYKRDVIFPIRYAKVKNNYYPCPNKSHEYLKIIYGDYENIPKIIQSHGLIDLKRKVSDEENSYTVAINDLRKINQSFNK